MSGSREKHWFELKWLNDCSSLLKTEFGIPSEILITPIFNITIFYRLISLIFYTGSQLKSYHFKPLLKLNKKLWKLMAQLHIMEINEKGGATLNQPKSK